MADKQPRRQSWMRSQSDTGFKPIKQVGIATSIGFPLMVIGSIMVILLIVYAGPTTLLIVGGAVLLVGLIAAASGRIL